ncbi:MAG: hypothetical protein IT190_05120 [Microbacteriaceae bacterium]|nr:hypothetical protein [Microbacteriaceae bacterium]
MNWWLFGGILLGIVLLGWLGQHFGLIDLSNKSWRERRKSPGGVMTIGDEVFAPTKHEAAVERNTQATLPAPAPLAGDGDKGIYGGTIVLEIPKDEK